jgi:hypothetical protein
MRSFIKEFKEFINRGSVLDLAVGIVIGIAFTTVVNSFVNGAPERRRSNPHRLPTCGPHSLHTAAPP